MLFRSPPLLPCPLCPKPHRLLAGAASEWGLCEAPAHLLDLARYLLLSNPREGAAGGTKARQPLSGAREGRRAPRASSGVKPSPTLSRPLHGHSGNLHRGLSLEPGAKLLPDPRAAQPLSTHPAPEPGCHLSSVPETSWAGVPREETLETPISHLPQGL